MDVSNPDPEAIAKIEVFAGGGEMGATMRAIDWAKTALGPVASWSLTLRMMVRFLLANRFPLLLWWGPQFCQLYNDPYRPVLGTKHPRSMGQPASQCFPEIWDIIGPLIQTPFDGGPATWVEDLPLEVHRHGFAEETHFTVAYSPVPDETVRGGIGGVLATVHEISEKVVGERRISALRDLGAGSGETRTAEEVCARAAETLTHYPKDVPFVLLYLIESERRTARLAGAAGIEQDGLATSRIVDLGDPASAVWPISEIIEREQIQLVQDLRNKLGGVPPGPWSDPPNSAAVLPIRSNVAHQIAGFMVAGLNPRLRFDDSYRSFLDLACSQIATAVASARAYEEERKRAEALAEIDRAKTAFFTNISHEFRTPLTLLLGPLEDTLAEPGLPPQAEQRLRLAHRNSLRLLKLVNALLDFSRIEARRVQAVYEPVDLAMVTADLASVFRSAIERAGMELIIDCLPLDRPVYVDREMWEKIVLNLLSNAFKFTLKGQIVVTLKAAGEAAEFTVRDSGSGITAQELPHIFERFYRAKGSPGRSYEGSGIGLALVQELVKLQGGIVRVETEPGRGSTFTVLIPFGSAHLPADRIGAARTSASTAAGAAAYVEEALRWLPGEEDVSDDPKMAATLTADATYARAEDSRTRARVLLADDNADMREYVHRLLAANYDVEAVTDGKAALQAALQRRPDLVVSDVMMPELDGFGVLKALRADERTATVPVILLSARAGEESRVEGIAAGADDYIVKPFAAHELVARVGTHLALSRIRRETEEALRESEERFRALVTASSDVVYRINPDWSEMRQLRGRDFIADTETPSRIWLQRYIHPDDQSRVMAVINEAIRTKSIFELEHRILRVDGSLGWTFSRAIPLQNANGEIVEWFGTATDVTERKRTEEALLRSEKLASVGRMAASIAHEINNPLEAVMNTLYLARTNADDPASVRQYLDIAEDELKRISHITRQTLGFYRESSAPATVSVNSIMDSAVDLLRGKIKDRGARIAKQYDGDFQVVTVAGELRQVFSNLLINSLDAIEERGAIKLHIVRSTCVNTGQHRIRVTVADDGKGIDAATLPRIFDPLFTTKEATGSGLGLWVSKQIIEKHGGSIRVYSRSGGPRSSSNGALHGTVFSVLLPIKPPAAARTGQ